MSQDEQFSRVLDDLEDALVKIAEEHGLSPYELGFLLDLFAHSTLHVLIVRLEFEQRKNAGK